MDAQTYISSEFIIVMVLGLLNSNNNNLMFVMNPGGAKWFASNNGSALNVVSSITSETLAKEETPEFNFDHEHQ